jgi:hypothetical protein
MSTCFLFSALNATVNAVIETSKEACSKWVLSSNFLSCGIEKGTILAEGVTNLVGSACPADVSESEVEYGIKIYADKTLEAYPQFAEVVNCIVNKLNDVCDVTLSSQDSGITVGATLGGLIFVGACGGLYWYCIHKDRLKYEAIPETGASQSGLFQRCSNWLWRSSENPASTETSTLASSTSQPPRLSRAI